jgi:T-complex protein 1 subunit gamma
LYREQKKFKRAILEPIAVRKNSTFYNYFLGLFEIKKIGDEYFAYFVECKEPSACSIILRGASKDVLNEMERNLHDCLSVAKNICIEQKLLPGGGAVEMELSARLLEKAKGLEGLA